MKSLAVWYKGSVDNKAIVDIHVNFWKLPSHNNSFVRFLDLGLNIHNAKKIDELYLYLPFSIASGDLDDLGRVIANSTRLLTAIFNEDYKITSASNSNYHEVKDHNGIQAFNIYEMNKDNFSVLPKHRGTVVTIKLPPESIREEKTYLRFRILGSALEGFSRIEKNVSSVFNGAFSKIEIFDFRINSTRHLPNKLLEEMARHNSFSIVKIHFFHICSYRENYLLSHRPFFGARRLEDDIWDEYLFGKTSGANNSNRETLIAYHWKEKSTVDNPIEKFNVLMKTTFRHNDLYTITKYLIFLVLFSFSIGLLSNFAFSKIINIMKSGEVVTEELDVSNVPSSKAPNLDADTTTEKPSIINQPDMKKE